MPERAEPDGAAGVELWRSTRRRLTWAAVAANGLGGLVLFLLLGFLIPFAPAGPDRQLPLNAVVAAVYLPLALALGTRWASRMSAPLERFSQNDVLLYGLAGIYSATDRINLVGEVSGRASTRKGDAPLGTESSGQFRLGTQIKASSLRFDTAAIFGLTKYSPRTGVTFGVTYQSPSIFTPAK